MATVDFAPPTAIDIDITSSAIDIDVDTTSSTIVNIAAPTAIDATSTTTMLDITESTIIDTARPSIVDSTLVLSIDSPATTTIDPISSLTGAVLARTEGFDMAFGLFNFHVDSNDVAELISISESTPPVANPSTPPAIGGNTSTTTSLAPSEEEPRQETSTPSVGSNDFQDPPPSPTTAYCVERDAYHFLGAEDFLAHEIASCEDPRGVTAAMYLMIFECKQALNALMLQPTPYDPDYVEVLYLDYTCSDDDVYPEAKGKIGNSVSFCSSKSAISGSGYVVDYDSDTMIEAGSCIGDDNIYPLAQGEISDDSTLPFGGHYMMASHGDGNEHRANNNRDRSNVGGRFITQNQIRHARKVYSGEVSMGPNPSPEEVAALCFIIQEQKDQISSERRILE
jgi:hypothetical protein